ncbi:MAG: hypothetical protein ACQETH_02935 [Candidatus Rifleibacteriota bacterium]
MNKNIPNGLYAAFDLGSASLKASVIEVNNSTPRLAAIEEESLQSFNKFPDENEYRNHLIEKIQALAERLPIKECKKVSLLFSNREMQVKLIELPAQVQSEQIDKILNWEAKKLLSPSFREEPYTFSYKIIRSNPYLVALAVIPQNLLEKFLELYEKAGINVSSIYAEVFTAHTLKETVDHTGLPALSIINFGHTGTHLQIFSAGDLRFYRFIPSGMAEMSQPPTENELEMYSQKIRFSFDYFRAVSKLNQIDAVFFMGGGAAQPNILPFERSYFNPTKINIVDISSQVDISPILPEISDNSPAEEKQRKLLPFLPSVGAILTLFNEDADKTDFAQRLNKEKKEKKLQELTKTMPFIIAACGIIIIILSLFYLRDHLNQKLKKLNKELEIAQIDMESANLKIAKYKAAADSGVKLSPAARKILKPIIHQQNSMARILYIIGSSKPENVKIQEVLIRPETEAENIKLENIENEPQYSSYNQNPDAEDEKSDFISELAQESMGMENQFDQELGKEIIIIRGVSQNNEMLAKLTEVLKQKHLFKRIKSLKSHKVSAQRIEFLLKGEML